MKRSPCYALTLAATLIASVAVANDWGSLAVISNTMGVHAGRLCMGEGLRVSDIGCPTYAPSVTTAGDVSITGNVSANKFIGDGSLLTGLTASGDRITSGTLSMTAISNTGYISLTTAPSNVAWGYFSAAWSYLPKLWAGQVLTTTISATWAQLMPQSFSSVIGAGGNAIVSGTTNVTTASGGSITFVTNNSQRMVIDNSGQVGIGTAAPNALLDVAGLISTSSLTVNGVAITGGGATQWTTTGSDIYYNTGKVGIGTTAPSYPLHVKAANEAMGSAKIVTYAEHTSTNGGGSSIQRLYSNGYSTDIEQNSGNAGPFRYGSTYADSMLSNAYTGTGAYGSLQFATGGSTRMTVMGGTGTTAGNVGIGTTSPLTKLDITTANNSDVLSGGLSFARAGTGERAVLGSYFKSANARSGPSLTTSASINLIYNTAGSTYDFNIFNNVADSSIDTATPAFTITDAGNVGIGTSAPSTFKLEVAGDIGPNATTSYNLGSTGLRFGCIWVSTGSTGSCASDQRLKTNIRDLTFGGMALQKVAALRPRAFEYKKAPGQESHGLIAQEVQKVAPEFVETDPSTTMLKVNYSDIQWLTLEAVQQLKSANDNLVSETTLLRATVAEQGKQIDDLKAMVKAAHTR